MSASRPPRCLFSIATPKAMPRPTQRHQKFHTSPNLCVRHRPKTKSIKAEDMGLVQPKPRFADITKRPGRLPLSLADGPFKKVPSEKLFKPYSKEEKEILAKKYTADQLRVIEAGEKAVAHQDLKSHGMIRDDRYALPYVDDLSRYDPQLDLKPREYDDGLERPERKEMNHDERVDVMAQWLDDIENGRIPSEEGAPDEERPTPLDFFDKHAAGDFMNGKAPKLVEFEMDGQRHVQDTVLKGKQVSSPFVNYELPKFKDPDNVYKQKGDQGDEEGVYDLLIKQTGMELDDIKNLNVKLLVSHRVVNQTRLGKIQSMYYLAIAGNGRGLLGIGEGKSTESPEAMKQARLAAIRNMKPVPMYEKRTIFGDVYGKVAATEVSLHSRPPGFGLRVQHNIFEMARAAGLHDLSARVPRSRNKMNTIKAAYQALMSQRIPDEVARGRGRKLVDVRKVYYAGRSPA